MTLSMGQPLTSGHSTMFVTNQQPTSRPSIMPPPTSQPPTYMSFSMPLPLSQPPTFGPSTMSLPTSQPPTYMSFSMPPPVSQPFHFIPSHVRLKYILLASKESKDVYKIFEHHDLERMKNLLHDICAGILKGLYSMEHSA
ncbi:hypothetical protein ACH5RR_028816 [Cinchona calisaya]|uniref:Uncharacterized protein n=1 Tax=Cinchona calisaya TaxID=153742 RepID=A0ABD2YTG5_9GENT